MTRFITRRRGPALVAAALASLLAGTAAHAERITNPVAEFAGLDKITGRIITFDVYMDETVQFGALQVTPRACYSRPATEQPQTDAFVEVDEITLNRKVRRIFSGWMFADSPGLHAVDHAVYDVWLANCKTSSTVAQPSKP
ncbi:MAG: glycosyl hydrolase family 5 [Kaistia sp. SCN 65-12]|nr:MAG: glycosyl hydrolase family 5 [Kaistia sp. SCN 65-12]